MPTNTADFGDYTAEFYHVNVARLAFIVVFEVILFYLVDFESTNSYSH